MSTRLPSVAALFIALLAPVGPAPGAGTLTPLGATEQPIGVRDHHADVVINNGFARTEITQTFFNPNDRDLEAIYAFPVPRSASLSEFTIFAGELEIDGEVLPKEEARRIYGQERDAGNDAGLAEQNSYSTYEFHVSPVRARDETRIRFVYYQPIEIDTGVGRYVYPLEEGNTDDAAASFWTTNDAVAGTLSIDVEVKSAWPLADVRAPGFQSIADVRKLDEGHYQVHLEQQGARLDRDFVLYYKLADDLPGRAEVLTYRADSGGPGTFMMVLTPGLDLQPITTGADYVFVLDVSGSMQGEKIAALARGVSRAIGEFREQDRYRIVLFNDGARELTRGWAAATAENVQRTVGQIEGIAAGGSTNLFAGLDLGLKSLDDDRATSLVLVTDAVTNTGVVDPGAFHRLMQSYDIRVFGFLMGNSANWPLMRTICDASGGFHARISSADDVLGQIMLAKSKITHECLHDATLKIDGVEVHETTGEVLGKVYRGQQLVLFGRYEGPGEATLTLAARLSGEDRTYRAKVTFPESDTMHPELERLWALARIEEIQVKSGAGLMSPGEAEHMVTSLGVEYQIVTDYTSMVVLADERFQEHGIERRNRDRVALERQVQALRAQGPFRSARADQAQPMFSHSAPNVSNSRPTGGGAIDPVSALLAAGLGGLALAAARRRRRDARAESSA